MTDTICQHPSSYVAAPSARETVRAALAHWAAWTLRAVAVTRQRRALKRLDARMLADIGVTRDQASKEAERPFWDLPKA